MKCNQEFSILLASTVVFIGFILGGTPISAM